MSSVRVRESASSLRPRNDEAASREFGALTDSLLIIRQQVYSGLFEAIRVVVFGPRRSRKIAACFPAAWLWLPMDLSFVGPEKKAAASEKGFLVKTRGWRGA